MSTHIGTVITVRKGRNSTSGNPSFTLSLREGDGDEFRRVWRRTAPDSSSALVAVEPGDRVEYTMDPLGQIRTLNVLHS